MFNNLTKVFSIIVFATLLLILSGVGFFALQYGPFLIEWGEQEIKARVYAETELYLDWEQLTVFPVNRIVIRDVALYNSKETKPLVSAEKLILNLNFLDLLRGSIDILASIEELELFNLDLNSDNIPREFFSNDIVNGAGNFSGQIKIFDSRVSFSYNGVDEELSWASLNASSTDHGWQFAIDGGKFGQEKVPIWGEGFYQGDKLTINASFENLCAEYLMSLWHFDHQDRVQINKGIFDGHGSFYIQRGFDFDFQGQLNLSEGEILIPELKKPLHGIEGKVSFDRHQLALDYLTTNWMSSELKLTGASNIFLEMWDLDLQLKFPYLLELMEIIDWTEQQANIEGAALINAKFKGSPAEPELFISAELSDISWQDVSFATVLLELTYQEDYLVLERAKGNLAGGGWLDLTGELAWVQGNPHYQLNINFGELAWQDIPLILREQLEFDLTGQFAGTVEVKGTSADFRGLSANGDVIIEDFYYQDLSLKTINASFEYQNQKISLNPLTAYDQKGAQLIVEGDYLFEQGFDWQVCIENFALENYFPSLKGRLSLAGQLTGQGENIGFGGTLQAFDVYGEQFNFEQLKTSFDINNSELKIKALNLIDDQDELTLKGRFDLQKWGTFSVIAEGIVDEVEKYQLYFNNPLLNDIKGSVNFELNLNSKLALNFDELQKLWEQQDLWQLTADYLSGSVHFSLSEGLIYHEPINSLETHLTYQNQNLTVDYLNAFFQEGALRGYGYLEATGLWQFNIEAERIELKNLEIIKAFDETIAGKLDFNGILTGDLQQFELGGDVFIQDLKWNGTLWGDVAGDITTDGEKAISEKLVLESPFGYVNCTGFLNFTQQEMDLFVEIMDSRTEIILDVLLPDLSLPLTEDSFELLGAGRAYGSLLNPQIEATGSLQYNGDVIEYLGQGRFFGPYEFTLKGTEIDLSFLESAFALSQFRGESGDFEAYIHLDQELIVTVNNSLRGLSYEDFYFDEISGQASWVVGEDILINQQVKKGDDFVDIEGLIPLNPELRGLDLTIKTSGVNLDFFSKFSPLILSSQGRVKGEVVLKGSIWEPQFFGPLYIENASLVHVDVPGTFTNIDGEMIFEGEQVTTYDFWGGFDNRGSINVEGTIFFTGWLIDEYDLFLAGRDLAIKHGSYDARGDAALTVQGPFYTPQIRGEVDVYNTNVKIPVSWPQEAREALNHQGQGLFDPDVVIRINAGNNVRIKDYYYDVIIQSADLQVDNSPGYFELIGEVMARQGNLTFYNTTFRLVEGRAKFLRFANSIPNINVRAQTEISEHLIMVHLTGPALNMDLSLSSTPPRTEEEIINLLVRRGGFGELLAGDLGGVFREEIWRLLGEELRTLFLSELEASLEAAFALDEFSILPRLTPREGSLHFRVGKSLSEYLYLVYSHSFFGDHDHRELGIELKLHEQIRLESKLQQEGVFQISIEFNIPF